MRNVGDVPAMAALRLVKIHSDGAWSLISLAHRTVLAEGDIRTDATVPAIELDEALERRAAELAGREYDGGFPGWDAICNLLNELVPAATKQPDVLGQIVEVMYPGGDPDAAWSSDTLNEIAAILDAGGLRPQAAEAALDHCPQMPRPLSIKCVVACRNASGEPDFFPCAVDASQEQYDEGDHYAEAARIAAEQGYEGDMLVYDENDGPDWLFDRLFPAEGSPADAADAPS